MVRQLASFNDIEFTYNENGIRTSKTVNGVKTTFCLDGTNIIEQSNNDNTICFYYDSNDEITAFRHNYKLYFYVKNSMGDITGITDSNGDLITTYEYDPWGKVISISGDTVIGELNPFRYRSYYYDSDIEMYYLQSRYYDPEVGRFINCDDVSFIGATGSEISYNPFAYCENNPVNDSDPWGFWKIKTWIVATSLDVIFSVLNSAMAAGYLSFSSTIYFLARSPYTRELAITIIKNTVIPVYVRGFYNFALTSIRKVLQTFGRVGKEFAKGWTSDKVSNYVKKFVNIDPIDFVLSILTWGGIIALVFDCLDGKWDGNITINNRR